MDFITLKEAATLAGRHPRTIQRALSKDQVVHKYEQHGKSQRVLIEKASLLRHFSPKATVQKTGADVIALRALDMLDKEFDLKNELIVELKDDLIDERKRFDGILEKAIDTINQIK